MGNVIVTMFMSLDGMIDEPQHWTFDYWNDQTQKFKFGELMATDAHLLGRVTYQGFAAAWPHRDNADEFTARMNSLPKYVVSTTLKSADWNNSHIISNNVADEIRKLKAQYQGDILVAGSATLVDFLLQNDLVDEYRLLVYPVTLGKGTRLFNSDTKLNLTESETYDTGVLMLKYHPDR